LLLIFAASAATAAPIECAQIVVSDGDTINIGGKQSKTAWFDTPETQFGRYRCDLERERGGVAKKRLEKLSTPVRSTSCFHRRDRYKRPLAYLSVDGRDVGEIFINEG